jgi:hypothetical protein
MSKLPANPAVLPQPHPRKTTQASESLSTVNGKARRHSLCGGLDGSKVAAIAANFLRRDAEEILDLGCVCRIASRRLFGHCVGGLPAPGGNSLFCFGCAALRVTVSLEILFGKYTKKISPDPPEMQSFGTWEPAPLARLRPV